MTSSLAAALAASAVSSDTRNKNDLNDLPPSSRPSSLMQYKQKYEVEKGINTGKKDTSKLAASKSVHDKKELLLDSNRKNDEDSKCDTGTNDSHQQHENNNIDVNEAPKSSGVSFVCDIPSDSDDEDGVDKSREELEINADRCQSYIESKKPSKKRGGRKKKGRSTANTPDAVKAA